MSPDLPQPIPEEPPEGLQEALPGAREENPQAVRPPRGRSEESFGGEIRFTAITVPSVYSQDSAPSTAKSFATSEDSAMSPRSEGLHEEGGPRTHLRSFEWGRKRDGRIMDDSISLTDTDETADGGVSKSSVDETELIVISPRWPSLAS